MKNSRWMLSVLVLLAIALLGGPVFGTALTENRDTPMRTGQQIWLYQGSNIIYAGSMVAIRSNGLAEAASDTPSINVVGRADEYSDNTGANYSATNGLLVSRGIFKWENGDSIIDGNIGDLCYVTDDQTVQVGASASNIIAGAIVDVDPDGDVWVDTFDIGVQGSETPASLAVAGAATVGTTLGVDGAVLMKSTVGMTGPVTIANALLVLGAQTNSAKVVMKSTLSVTGAVDVSGNVYVGGIQTNYGKLCVTGAVTCADTLTANGLVTATTGLTTPVSVTTPLVYVYGATAGSTGAFCMVSAAGSNAIAFVAGYGAANAVTNVLDGDVNN